MGNAIIIGPLAASSAELPFYSDYVPAGFPSPAQDHLQQKISLDELLNIDAPQTFLAQDSNLGRRADHQLGMALADFGNGDLDAVMLHAAQGIERVSIWIQAENDLPAYLAFEDEVSHFRAPCG